MTEEARFVRLNRRKYSRRSFMENTLLGAGVLSLGGIAGSAGFVLAGDKAGPSRTTAAAAMPDHPAHVCMDGGVSAGVVKHSAEDMDRMHREGLELFMKNQTSPITAGKGNVPL